MNPSHFIFVLSSGRQYVFCFATTIFFSSCLLYRWRREQTQISKRFHLHFFLFIISFSLATVLYSIFHFLFESFIRQLLCGTKLQQKSHIILAFSNIWQLINNLPNKQCTLTIILLTNLSYYELNRRPL